ncbi:MAG: alpha/beta hydrolase [Chlorobi bacterium]|nr:alpha/beta hydrolase [Chlorobiota bacterium]
MIKQIYKNNLSINYKDEGSENETVIVLIHGFLETSETWANFSKELAKNYRVISVDLPGHGKSNLHNEPFTMCKYADAVANVIEYEQINNAFVVGHSMGGYVALAFAEKYPKKMSALSLFHSSPFADNDEKKNARLATIERIKNGEKDEICINHAKSVFANDNVKKFSDEISKGENIAKSISEEGIIASLLTMKDRNDRSDILRNLNVPFLYIIGQKDNFIPMEILDKIEMPKNYKVEILENSGHQGFIEQKEKSLKIINDFVKEFI